MTAAKPVPDVGDVHAIQEDQYKFGLGPILVRGVSVRTGVVFDNAQWWTVQAEVADGTHAHHGNWILREIYVTDSVLKTIHRPESDPNSARNRRLRSQFPGPAMKPVIPGVGNTTRTTPKE